MPTRTNNNGRESPSSSAISRPRRRGSLTCTGRGDANLGDLESCMKSLNEIFHASPFLEEFVTMDSKEMRTALGADFSERVKVGTMKLSGPTECLVKTCLRLNKMHKASLEERGRLSLRAHAPPSFTEFARSFMNTSELDETYGVCCEC